MFRKDDTQLATAPRAPLADATRRVTATQFANETSRVFGEIDARLPANDGRGTPQESDSELESQVVRHPERGLSVAPALVPARNQRGTVRVSS